MSRPENRQERIDLILDHYEHPRHAGILSPADAVETGSNPGCGDMVTVYLRLDEADQRVTLAFQAQGCTISQAAASMVMETMQGWTLEQIEESTPAIILERMGPDIAAARERCAILCFNTIKATSQAYRRRQAAQAL